MTVSSEVSKAGPYTGNGVTVSFPFSFRILNEDHILVVKTEGGNDTTVTTGYSVTGVGAGSGSVIFDVAPTAAQQITILRNVPATQELDLINQGAYFAEDVERAFDLAVMRDQQLQEQIDRSVKVPVGGDGTDLETLISYILTISSIADEVETVSGIALDVEAVAAVAAEVVIVAGMAGSVQNFSDVYQGAKATPPATRNDGTPLQTGDLYFDTGIGGMQVRSAGLWVSPSAAVNGTLQREIYTATAGQTVFNCDYQVGFVDVYLNGVKLLIGTEFTATNGTSITLASGAAVDDVIEIIGFGAFALSNMLEKSQNGADIVDKAAFRSNVGLGATSDVTHKSLTVDSYTVANRKALTSMQVFNASGTFVPPAGVTEVYAVVVGGGGGGGQYTTATGGWGGSGGVGCNFVPVSGSMPVTVGPGGDGNNSGNGSAGSNSVFGSITAFGGAGGTTSDGANSGNSGGFNSGWTLGSISEFMTNFMFHVDPAAFRLYPGFAQKSTTRSRGTGRSAAIAYNINDTYHPGAAGGGESSSGNNAAGGVGGAVFIFW